MTLDLELDYAMFLLIACAHVHLPPPTPGEDAAVLLSHAVAPGAAEYAPWRTWGSWCLALYGRGVWVPTVVRCGPRWGAVEDVGDVVALLRAMP